MQTKLTQANAQVVQLWAAMNGVSAQDLVNKIIGIACSNFLDGIKGQVQTDEKTVERL